MTPLAARREAAPPRVGLGIAFVVAVAGLALSLATIARIDVAAHAPPPEPPRRAKKARTL